MSEAKKDETVSESKTGAAVLEREAATYGKKKAAAPELVYGEAEHPKIDWDENLLRILRIFHIKSTDIPNCPEEGVLRTELVRKANAGDTKARAVLNTTLNLVLECMGRFRRPRQLVDAQNRLLFLDPNEQLTIRKFSATLKDSEGHALRHEKAMQVRSEWGVKPGVECQSAAGTPVPRPGHYKTLVEENFDDLFPKLYFMSEKLDSREADPTSRQPETRAAYLAELKAQCDDSSERRQEVLKWLPAFIKKPVNTWDGEV